MSSGFEIEEEFHGFHLSGNYSPPSYSDLPDIYEYVYRFYVHTGNPERAPNARMVGSLTTGFTKAATVSSGMKNWNKEQIIGRCRDIAYSRVKAMIDLRFFKVNQTIELRFDGNQEIPVPDFRLQSPSDEDIQIWLLRAFHGIRESQPSNYKLLTLDVDGFCAVLGLEVSQYEYNAGYLVEEGLLEHTDGKETPASKLVTGHAFITNEGSRLVSSGGATKQNLVAFLAHSSNDETLANQVKDLLEAGGLEVFKAPEDAPRTEDFRDTLSSKLRDSSLLIALVTENFRESSWTDQEVGFALATGSVVYPLFVEGIKLHGFLDGPQGDKIDPDNPKPACDAVIEFLKNDDRFRHHFAKQETESLDP